jgi:hypothetical protein
VQDTDPVTQAALQFIAKLSGAKVGAAQAASK